MMCMFSCTIKYICIDYMFSSNRMLISLLLLLFFLERASFSLRICFVLQHLTIGDLLLKPFKLFFRASHEVLVELQLFGILLELTDKRHLASHCVKLDRPIGQGEWRLLLSLFFLSLVVLLFLVLGVFDLFFRIFTNWVVLEHLQH